MSTASRDNPAFCALAFFHIYVRGDGASTLCCVSDRALRDAGGRPVSLATHTFPEIWNSAGMNAARTAMLAGRRDEGCWLCWHREALGQESPRLFANRLWFDARRTEADAFARHGFCPEAPTSFDLRLGNRCNFRCRTCNAVFSSAIEADPLHGLWTQDYTPDRTATRFPGPARDWWRSRQLLEELDAFSARADFLQVAGGEPVLNPVLMGWLGRLRRSGRSRGVDVSLWTNGSRLGPALARLLAGFRSVEVNLSLDGKGPLNDYIRHGSNWQDILARLDAFLAVLPARVRVVPVAQLYNILDLDGLLAWALERGFSACVNTVNGAPQLDYALLPEPERSRIAARLANLADGLDPEAHRELADQLRGLVRDMHRTIDGVVRRGLLADFVHFTNDLDADRRQSIRDSCPELANVVTRELGGWDLGLRHFRRAALYRAEV